MTVYKITTNSGTKFFAIENDNLVSYDLREPQKWCQQMGGIEKVMGKAEKTSFSSLEEAMRDRNRILREKAEKMAKSIEEEYRLAKEKYDELVQRYEIIPTTIDNIRTVLKYLSTKHWGIWELPKMNAVYTAAQYDCDGYIVSTLSLVNPIEDENGNLVKDFKCGFCPKGHLQKYISL